LAITKYSLRDTVKEEIEKIREVDQNYKNKNVFLEKISCSEIKFLISLRSDGIDKIISHEGSELSSILFWLNKVPNFSEAEFKLNPVNVEGERTSYEQYWDEYKKIASHEFKVQAYRIFTSSDSIGSSTTFKQKRVREITQPTMKTELETVNNDSLQGAAKTLSRVASSWYLSLRNLSHSQYSHSSLRNPLSLKEGFKCAGKGFYNEVRDGVTGFYYEPKKLCKTQGHGAK
jgi:hypothetical protein